MRCTALLCRFSSGPLSDLTTGTPTEDERERRDSTCTPMHIDTSESQSPQQREAPQAALGDVVAEVLRLRTQVQQLLAEREAGRVQSNALDPLPEYV